MAQSQTPTVDEPTAIDDDPDLTAGDLGRIEVVLKRELAEQMAAIQAGRAFDTTGHNVGTASDYVEDARTLRKVLQQMDRQQYVPLRGIHANPRLVADKIQDAADVDRDRLAETLEKLHDAGYVPPESRRVLAGHPSVPGQEGR